MVVISVTNFDQDKFYLLKHKIKETKSQYDSLLEAQPNEYLKGSRYEDNSRLANMVLGDLYQECDYSYPEANKLFLSLTSVEIEPYIRKAILESASADYYYKFEKNWD